MRTSSKLITLLALLTLSSSAFAHPGHPYGGIGSGLLHPFSGLDHLLGMVAVGLWAAQGGAQRVWLLPATFMAVLAIGAGVALFAPGLPLIETGIAASVLVLGLILALAVKVPATLSIALTAAFGFVHGYAHGSEMPALASPALYAAGFLIATAALHVTGAVIGLQARARFARWTQAGGALIALAGVWMLA
ncbi:MAG TPA: HupE/UreJ family protein [Gallionellaceae bacterium]